MNAFPFLRVTLVFLALFFTARGAERTATGRAWCSSLFFQRTADATTEFSLQLDNNELWPWTSSSYAAGVTLKDDWFDVSSGGYITIPLPGYQDANGNGWSDFFESAQAVASTTTTGSYELSGYGSGTLQATWARGAGASWGSCVLKFKPSPYYTWLTFNISFQLLEYRGAITYFPGSSTVTGRVDLVQTDAPDSVFRGPFHFTKSTSDRFNVLTLDPGGWTNAMEQLQTYTNNVFQRDLEWPTNYFGYVIFDDDFNSDTVYPFDIWTLSVDDLNDSNSNNIPDFSDDPAVSLPRQPSLALAVDQTASPLLSVGTSAVSTRSSKRPPYPPQVGPISGRKPSLTTPRSSLCPFNPPRNSGACSRNKGPAGEDF